MSPAEALMARATIVRETLVEELYRFGATLAEHTPAQFVLAAEAMADRIYGGHFNDTPAEFAAMLRAMGWTSEERKLYGDRQVIWWNPYGGGYTMQEAVERTLQARVTIETGAT